MDDHTKKIRDEGCRESVLFYLSHIPTLAQEAKIIWRFLSRQHDWTESEVIDALCYLSGDDLVKITRHKLGSTKYYQITTAGRRAVEQQDY